MFCSFEEVSYRLDGNEKTRYRPYDYAYIALWNSNRSTASNLVCKDSKSYQQFIPPQQFITCPVT